MEVLRLMGGKVIYQIGNFRLDASLRQLTEGEGGEEVGLSPKEFEVLLCLAEAGGLAVSRERMMQAVWPDTVVGDTSLAKCVSSLRRYLGKDAIAAVPKFGYRLAVPVGRLQEGADLSVPGQNAMVASVRVPHGIRGWFQNGPGWLVLATLLGLVALGGGRLRRVWAATMQLQAATWVDPQTGLEWARSDNGRDVSRLQAMAYCHGLDLNGERDWRLPTIEELQTLVDPAASEVGIWGRDRKVYWHVKGEIHLTGGESASDVTVLTDLGPAGEEQSYDFSYGRRNLDADGFSADHRALCVR